MTGPELTRRESATLAAVERRLSNAEIAAEFHVSVRTVESHIASLRRKLGVDSRAKLITAARARRGPAVQLPQNSFVGRDDELRTVRALLDRERWVTVVGPAGCGKTRLALEVAADGDRVPVVVELEHATAGEVPSAVAGAIGLGADSTADLVAACAVALGAQRHLLIVDNCDRVTGPVGAMVGELLSLTGSLTVLATSRSPLGGSDESVHALPPLPIDAGAVRLFLDRAGSAAPATRFSAADGTLVTRICRRLDGLPLAIELAAARVRHLSIPELASRLEDGLGPLDRSGAGRHRTLEAAFEWTWDLLDDDERAVLAQLAALPGTFDLGLAEAVTRPDAGRVVLRLLDRSLVSPAGTRTEPRRFRLLDSLRTFVLDRTTAAIAEQVRQDHAAHHARLAGELAGRARADDSRAAVEAAKRLSPEVSAAIDWAVARRHPLALPLATALAVLAEQYGPDIDSLDAIARAARDQHVRNTATATDLDLIGLALCYGDLALVAELAALALGRADDDRSALAAHHLAGYADAYLHDGPSALDHLAVAERLAAALGDDWQLASARQAKGLALRGREVDQPAAALAAFESSMQTYALAGDAMHVNNTRYMMAATAADAGFHTQQAAAWAEHCVDYARDSGNRHELAHALLTRTMLASEPGDDLGDAVATFRAVGDLRCLTRSYLLLAGRSSGAGQVPLLRQALDVANRAHDVNNQVKALERLIAAHWEAGSHRLAAVTLGALVRLVGEQAAARSRPAAMDLGRWSTAIIEGRARGFDPR